MDSVGSACFRVRSASFRVFMKKEDVKKLAALCRIEVPEKELEGLTAEFESILAYVSEISKVASEEIRPEAGELRNVMRKDADPHEPGSHTDAMLNAAPKREKDYIAVKKILP